MARCVAEEFLAGERDLWWTAAAFALLVTRGHEWVPGIFLFIDSELASIPAPDVRANWEPEALARVLSENEVRLVDYENDVRDAVGSILMMLDARPGSDERPGSRR